MFWLFMDLFIPIVLLVGINLGEVLGSAPKTFFVAAVLTMYIVNAIDDFKKYWRK